MTPKEKAIELVDKYWQLNYDWDGTTKEGWAKDGALIAVDEIMKVVSIYNDTQAEYYYWEEVQQEIENL